VTLLEPGKADDLKTWLDAAAARRSRMAKR
jgi:hypothetical protein